MSHPSPLDQIAAVLAAQDRALAAAHAALVRDSRQGPVVVSIDDLQRLRDACAASAGRRTPAPRVQGVRC
jgi:hypothetical protein